MLHFAVPSILTVPIELATEFITFLFESTFCTGNPEICTSSRIVARANADLSSRPPLVLSEDMVPDKWRPARPEDGDLPWWAVTAILSSLLVFGIVMVWVFGCVM